MSKEILRRLAALEQRFTSCPTIPSRDEWRAEWRDLDELSKAVFIVAAENMDELEEGGAWWRYLAAVRPFMLADGLLDPEAKTLREVAAEMDKSPCDV